MNRMLSVSELAELSSPLPDSEVEILTKREKLLRWAGMVRKHGKNLDLYHRLEYCSQAELDGLKVAAGQTSFYLAIKDRMFKEQGIGNTVGSVMKFFGLTKAELHEFSCDCGGEISNRQMADRIEQLAR